MMPRSRWAALGDVPVRFWACPIDGHSHDAWSPDPVQTVEWRKKIAYCLTPGCARTSDSPFAGDTRMVVDDGRTWWLLGAILWTGTHLYEARNARAALAAYRRDLTEAERSNGRSGRETRDYLWGAGLTAVAGPLTTVEAFQYDLARHYGDAIEQWRDFNIEVACPATPMTAVDLAERLDPADAARIRAQVRDQYLPIEVPARPTEAEYGSLPVLDIDQLGS